MGQIVLSDVTVTLGSVTIGTNCVKSVTLNFTPDMLDNTGMGHTAKSRTKGLDDWSADVEIYQDYADDGLDEDLWTLMAAGTPFSFTVKPTSAAISAINPYYCTGTSGALTSGAILESYSPIAAGSVGELGVAKLKILACGISLTRDVTA